MSSNIDPLGWTRDLDSVLVVRCYVIGVFVIQVTVLTGDSCEEC